MVPCYWRVFDSCQPHVWMSRLPGPLGGTLQASTPTGLSCHANTDGVLTDNDYVHVYDDSRSGTEAGISS